jgi:hypothetical protein
LFLIKENIMSQIPVSWKKIAKKRKEIWWFFFWKITTAAYSMKRYSRFFLLSYIEYH